MYKFSIDERKQLKSIIANLSIARLPDDEIAVDIERQTAKYISLNKFTIIDNR